MIDTRVARTRILERIRRAQGRAAKATDADRAAVSEYLESHPRGPQQHKPLVDAEQFKARAQSLSSTVETLASLTEVPAAVARYLAAHSVQNQIVVNLELAQLDWRAADLRAVTRPIENADLSAVTGAYAAISDTGTLAFLSSRDTPASNNLLPENHIVVVHEEQIVHAMEDVFDRVRAEFGELPRALNFVSGPSRTGDIEQKIVLGAHGPYRVHILLIAK